MHAPHSCGCKNSPFTSLFWLVYVILANDFWLFSKFLRFFENLISYSATTPLSSYNVKIYNLTKLPTLQVYNRIMINPELPY